MKVRTCSVKKKIVHLGSDILINITLSFFPLVQQSERPDQLTQLTSSPPKENYLHWPGAGFAPTLEDRRCEFD